MYFDFDPNSNLMNPLVSTYETSTTVYVCAIVILFYDHLLTFGMETRLVWKWPLRPLSIVFLVNRYFSLSVNIIRSLTRFRTVHAKKCLSILHLRGVFIAATGIFVATFQLWRISALYNHDKRVLGSMLVFLSVPVSLEIWGITTAPYSSVVDQPGCFIQESAPVTTNTGRLGITWICVFLWEVLIICLTVAKTWRVTRDTRKITALPFLSTLLLRDGLIYFLVMAIIYFLDLLTFYAAPHAMPKGAFSWLVACLSSTMMSRLMLNLREYMEARVIDSREPNYNTIDVTMSSIVFRQLDDLELHDLGHTIDADTNTPSPTYP